MNVSNVYDLKNYPAPQSSMRSQAELGRKVGLSQAGISKMKRSKRKVQVIEYLDGRIELVETKLVAAYIPG